jgi:hypothetical protein
LDAIKSRVNDVYADIQVGSVKTKNKHAVMWKGTPDSLFDLHMLLPKAYKASVATGVFVNNDEIWIAGNASKLEIPDEESPNTSRAVVWHYKPANK